MNDLAHHLARKANVGQTAELASCFALVERWITEGNDEVRGLTVVGLLEDLLLPHHYLGGGP